MDVVYSSVLLHDVCFQETDRGCALIVAEFLSDGLAELLRANFVPDQKLCDRLLRGDGPLSTFSARTELCFALGLLDANTYREIHLIRKIRNDFAHSFTQLTFDDDPVRSRCEQLIRVYCKTTQRSRFMRTAIHAMIHIRGAKHKSAQATTPTDSLIEIHNLMGRDITERVTKLLRTIPPEIFKEAMQSERPVTALLQKIYDEGIYDILREESSPQ